MAHHSHKGWAYLDAVYRRLQPEIDLVLDCPVEPVAVPLTGAAPLPRPQGEPQSGPTPGDGGGCAKREPQTGGGGAGAGASAPDAGHPAAHAAAAVEGVVLERPRVHAEMNLRRWIESGLLRPGLMLPSQRILAEKLRVSRRTIERALGVLVHEGWVEYRPGEKRPRVVLVRPADNPGSARAAPPDPPAPGVMRHTMAIALTQPGVLLPPAILAHCEESGVHVLVLHPTRLNEATIADLAARPPVAVMAVGPDPIDAAVTHMARTLRAAGVKVLRRRERAPS